ncbi:hypothetical protein, partial [Candidatus Thiosymbion oneisti]|uniref:hypothetical protein n=1 Tax=Candidatus Thiosymbion oneisti TaxID=589554 RepID=UPI001A9C5F75
AVNIKLKEHGRIERRLTGSEITRSIKPQCLQVECADGGVERPNAVGFADLVFNPGGQACCLGTGDAWLETSRHQSHPLGSNSTGSLPSP